VKIIPASDSSVMAVFGDAISPQTQDCVLALFRALQARKDARIRNLHPGYTSLLVDFDPLSMTHNEASATIEALAEVGLPTANDSPLLTIPVCYDAEFGLDLKHVAAHTGLSIAEVIRLHSGATYQVCFLGFTGGFAYLGGMPEELDTPRLATPRRAVMAETPGGWRLIGCTPVRMFDPQAQPPTRIQAGDSIRFSPIDHAEFGRLRQASQ